MQAAVTPRLTRKQKIEQGLPKLPDNRKKRMAQAIRVDRSQRVLAELINQPGSPTKYRLVIDLIRGKRVEYAMGVLKTMPHAACRPLLKLVQSAVNNWQEKNLHPEVDVENVVIKTLLADGAFMLKRVQPAPQGRAYRKRKRYSHLSIELGPPTIEETK
jgi:large subunit ribosomal protein L22